MTQMMMLPNTAIAGAGGSLAELQRTMFSTPENAAAAVCLAPQQQQGGQQGLLFNNNTGQQMNTNNNNNGALMQAMMLQQFQQQQQQQQLWNHLQLSSMLNQQQQQMQQQQLLAQGMASIGGPMGNMGMMGGAPSLPFFGNQPLAMNNLLNNKNNNGLMMMNNNNIPLHHPAAAAAANMHLMEMLKKQHNFDNMKRMNAAANSPNDDSETKVLQRKRSASSMSESTVTTVSNDDNEGGATSSGSTVQRRARGYWMRFTNVRNELMMAIEELGCSGHMPTMTQLRSRGHLALIHGLYHHGGAREVAARLGLKAPIAEGITEESYFRDIAILDRKKKRREDGEQRDREDAENDERARQYQLFQLQNQQLLHRNMTAIAAAAGVGTSIFKKVEELIPVVASRTASSSPPGNGTPSKKDYRARLLEAQGQQQED